MDATPQVLNDVTSFHGRAPSLAEADLFSNLIQSQPQPSLEQQQHVFLPNNILANQIDFLGR